MKGIPSRFCFNLRIESLVIESERIKMLYPYPFTFVSISELRVLLLRERIDKKGLLALVKEFQSQN